MVKGVVFGWVHNVDGDRTVCWILLDGGAILGSPVHVQYWLGTEYTTLYLSAGIAIS